MVESGDHGCVESGRLTHMSWCSTSSSLSSRDHLDDVRYHGRDSFGEDEQRSMPSGFLTLWENESLCDVELLTRDGTYIPAHKVVLAAHSPFFQAMFAGASSNMIENSRSSVSVENVDDITLTMLLRIMYGNISFHGAEDSEAVCQHLENAIFPNQNGYDVCVSKLLHAATYLMMQQVVDVCFGYLEHRMCEENVVDILILAREHECFDLYNVALQFMVSHFGALLQSWEGAASIHLLPTQVLVDVLNEISVQRDGLFVGVDIAEFLLLWARYGVQYDDVQSVIRVWYHKQKRMLYHDEYMMALEAVGNLERKGKSKLVHSEHALEFVRQCCTRQSTQGVSTTNDISTRASSPVVQNQDHCMIVVAGGICDGWKAMRSTEIYSTTTNTWAPGPDMPSDCSFTHASTCSNGNTYIPSAKGNTMMQYSDRDMSWHVLEMHGEMTTRVSSACVAHDSNVYIIGGRPTVGRDRHPSSLHECFDTNTCTWKTLSPMNVPRSSLDACVLFDRIWCVGGQSLRQTHNTMEWYEPALDSWYLSRSTLSSSRKYATVNSFCDTSSQLIIIGGMDDRRTRLHSVEAYDPREGRLRMMAPLPKPISSATSCVCGHEIYVIGGREGFGSETNRMYAFDPRMPSGKWRECRSMSTPRSSLASFTCTI